MDERAPISFLPLILKRFVMGLIKIVPAAFPAFDLIRGGERTKSTDIVEPLILVFLKGFTISKFIGDEVACWATCKVRI